MTPRSGSRGSTGSMPVRVAFGVDLLELAIPYELLKLPRSYYPDFIVRLEDGSKVIIEIKGEESDEDRAKHEAARRWVRAVNHWGKPGRWHLHACRDPQRLAVEIAGLMGMAGQALTPRGHAV